MQNPEKVWVPIEGYESFYQISNYGEVRSLMRKAITKGGGYRNVEEKILKPGNLKSGYLSVVLSLPTGKKNHLVHRLVGQHFIPNPHNYPQINHKSGDKKDNRAWMLEWNTAGMNLTHSFRQLGRKPSKTNQGNTGSLSSVSIQVFQYNLQNKLIEKHVSLTAAEKKTGIKLREISDCINNPKRITGGGFKWSKVVM